MKVATDAIVIENDKILLVQQRKAHAYGLWSFPGGHVEAGETVLAALKREISEELGAELLQTRPFEVNRLESDGGGDLELHTFLAKIQGEIITPEDELMAYGWFTLKEVEAMAEQLRKPLVLKLTRKAFALTGDQSPASGRR